MVNQKLLDKAQKFAFDQLANDHTGHDFWHLKRVANNAVYIAEQEKGDVFICALTAWLHDIADEKLNPSKEEGLNKVRNWLLTEKADASTIEHVMDIIANMSFNGGNNAPLKTLEGQIVQDADRLDAIGAIGVARTFMYGGAKGHAMHDPEIAPRTQITKEDYRQQKNTVINHFPEKLLKIKNLLNTTTAKKMAEEKHAFMELFLKQFNVEWEGHPGF